MKKFLYLIFFTFCFFFSGCHKPTQNYSTDKKVKTQRHSQNQKKTLEAFDFYILSLSWSPTYCHSSIHQKSFQCKIKKPYGAILHGLWPQLTSGQWPSFCPVKPKKVPKTLMQSLFDIMPSSSLIQHEWKKHGSCSGLLPETYFHLARQGYKSVHMPKIFTELGKKTVFHKKIVKEKIMQANPALNINMFSLNCKGGALTEIRYCLDKKAELQTCPSALLHKEEASCSDRILVFPKHSYP